MGETAENLAERYDISREQQDELALLSHQRASHALEQGYFEPQIVPITVKNRRSELVVSRDENPRAGLTEEKLSSLKPAFRAMVPLPPEMLQVLTTEQQRLS
jgi:acetyl-CoA C-acetyltransferase